MAPLLYTCILLLPLASLDSIAEVMVSIIIILSLLDIDDCELAEIESSIEETYV